MEFDSLYTITNMPIARYLEWLDASGNLHTYMQTLVEAFNPQRSARRDVPRHPQRRLARGAL